MYRPDAVCWVRSELTQVPSGRCPRIQACHVCSAGGLDEAHEHRRRADNPGTNDSARARRRSDGSINPSERDWNSNQVAIEAAVVEARVVEVRRLPCLLKIDGGIRVVDDGWAPYR